MATIVTIITTEARGGLGHSSAGLPPEVWSVKEEGEAWRLTTPGRRGRKVPGYVGASRRLPRGTVTTGTLGGSSEGSKAWKLQILDTPRPPWGGEGACSLISGEPGGRWWSLPLL